MQLGGGGGIPLGDAGDHDAALPLHARRALGPARPRRRRRRRARRAGPLPLATCPHARRLPRRPAMPTGPVVDLHLSTAHDVCTTEPDRRRLQGRQRLPRRGPRQGRHPRPLRQVPAGARGLHRPERRLPRAAALSQGRSGTRPAKRSSRDLVRPPQRQVPAPRPARVGGRDASRRARREARRRAGGLRVAARERRAGRRRAARLRRRARRRWGAHAASPVRCRCSRWRGASGCRRASPRSRCARCSPARPIAGSRRSPGRSSSARIVALEVLVDGASTTSSSSRSLDAAAGVWLLGGRAPAPARAANPVAAPPPRRSVVDLRARGHRARRRARAPARPPRHDHLHGRHVRPHPSAPRATAGARAGGPRPRAGRRGGSLRLRSGRRRQERRRPSAREIHKDGRIKRDRPRDAARVAPRRRRGRQAPLQARATDVIWDPTSPSQRLAPLDVPLGERISPLEPLSPRSGGIMHKTISLALVLSAMTAGVMLGCGGDKPPVKAPDTAGSAPPAAASNPRLPDKAPDSPSASAVRISDEIVRGLRHQRAQRVLRVRLRPRAGRATRRSSSRSSRASPRGRSRDARSSSSATPTLAAAATTTTRSGRSAPTR